MKKNEIIYNKVENIKSLVDLKINLINLKKDIFFLRIQLVRGKNNDTSQIKKIRKNIARIKTIINNNFSNVKRK